jgi:transcriptional regulator with XRE-family HTH domain
VTPAPPPGLVAQLRALRLERGLPLKVVAHELGVSLWWLCRLEHDSRYGLRQVERWAAVLGCDVAITPKREPPKLSRRAVG